MAPVAITESPSLSAPLSRDDLVDLAAHVLVSTHGGIDSTASTRRTFLKSKGLDDAEIDEAFRKAQHLKPTTPPPPLLPPRVHNSPNPLPVQVVQVQPVPNRTIVRFLRTLAMLITLTGGCSGIVALFFKRMLFSKLEQRTIALQQLTMSSEKGFETLLKSIKQLSIKSHWIWPNTSKLVTDDEPPLNVTTTSDDQPLKEAEKVSPPPEISSDLITQLHLLTTSLQSFPTDSHTSIPQPLPQTDPLCDDDDPTPSYLHDPSSIQSLITSLTTLSNYLTSPDFLPPRTSAYSNPYLNRSNISPTASVDWLGKCKNEVRGLKGMLLNRRNFTLPQTTSTT